MVECERCGDESKRRKLCQHCGHFVCRWCWYHECACQPGHKPENCVHLNAIRRHGRKWFMTRVVARLRTAAGLPLLRGMK